MTVGAEHFRFTAENNSNIVYNTLPSISTLQEVFIINFDIIKL